MSTPHMYELKELKKFVKSKIKYYEKNKDELTGACQAYYEMLGEVRADQKKL